MPKTKPLTILMLTEYFQPHFRGGSEWSTFYLSQALLKLGHKINILTPNYGAPSSSTWRGLNISRFNIGIKLKPSSGSVTPFWHTNIFWHFASLLSLIKHLLASKTDVIHVQGKYFLPAAVIAGKLKNIPVVFTARDYQPICSLGFCLWHSHKSCSLKDYFLKDFKFFKTHYNSSFLSPLFLLRSWWTTKILHFFARRVSALVCISNAQKKIYEKNLLPVNQVIYNTADFSSLKKSISKQKQIIFAGRLTPGKGAHLLVPTFAKLNKSNKLKLLIVGSGILRSTLKKQIRDLNLVSSIKLLGNLPHPKLLTLFKQSKLSFFPSIWPEPFGRGALESISLGTPVLTSNRGGLPEIVNRRYGLAVTPEVDNLSKALSILLKNHSKIEANIKADNDKLKQKFNLQPHLDYQALYYSL